MYYQRRWHWSLIIVTLHAVYLRKTQMRVQYGFQSRIITINVPLITDKKYSGWKPPPESFKKEIPMSSVHDDRGIYVRLYDISKDPEEKTNVAVPYRHIVYKLLHRLADYHDNKLVVSQHFFGEKKQPEAAIPKETYPGELLAWKPWLPWRNNSSTGSKKKNTLKIFYWLSLFFNWAVIFPWKSWLP